MYGECADPNLYFVIWLDDHCASIHGRFMLVESVSIVISGEHHTILSLT